jgi:pimeloyl-ACP methyl ester carboxylesterase
MQSAVSIFGENNPDPNLERRPWMMPSRPHCAEPVFVPQASHLLPEDAPEVLAEKVLETGRTRSNEPLFKIL